jgi:hypothetical protein
VEDLAQAVILKSSANGLSGLNVLNLEMELRPDMGVNHQECMNHRFVTDKFKYIFDGLAGLTGKSPDFIPFFTIPER